MENNRGVRSIAIVALLIAVTGISVAFAALSQSLTINGSGKISGSEWKVLFKSGVGEWSKSTLGMAVAPDPAFTSNSTIVTFSGIELYQPGDSVTYTFTAINQGTIDAKLNAEPIISGTITSNDKIEYELTYSNDSKINSNDSLDGASVVGGNDGETRTYKLFIKFKDSVTDVTESDENFDLTATLNFVQK